MSRFRVYLLLASLLVSAARPVPAFAGPDASALEHAQKGDSLLEQGLQFQAISEYRQAVRAGISHPDLYRNLAIALFEIGLLDEALAELEKAVEIFPGSDLMHLELGILYLAKNNLAGAEEQLFAALALNPASAASYYYLAEGFFRAKQYDYAWLAARMAMLLGHPGGVVVRDKLVAAAAPTPAVSLWHLPEREYHLRQIIVDTSAAAAKILVRLRQGELFEDIAGGESLGANTDQGGYAGRFQPGELQPEIIEALSRAGILGEPVSIKAGEQFLIVQQIPPFDFHLWQLSLQNRGQSAPPAAEAAAGRVAEPRAGEAETPLPAARGPEPASPAAAEIAPAVVAAADKTVRVITPAGVKRKVAFVVRVGVFSEVEEAEERLARLRALALPGYISRRKDAKGVVTYGVVAVRTESQRVAQETVQKLKEAGFECFLGRD